MKMLDIKYVRSEDWQGLYVNGWLKIEGHSISTYQVIYIVASYLKEAKDFTLEELVVNQEWMEEQGDLPNKFYGIPEEAIEWRYE